MIPDSVTKIGSSFAYCPSLTSVTLGSGVTEIGASAFSDCFRLVEIYNFSGIELEKGSDANGYIAKYALSIYNVKDTPSKLTTDENGFIIYTESPVTSYLIGYVGTATDVTVPEGVKMLRDYAFYGCDTLTSITLGKDVNEIGKEVFAGCTALTAINVNEENDNFSSEEGVLFNVNKTKLIKYPIAKSASSYKVPTPVTEIGEKAFLGCEKLEGVILDINVKVIGKNAFEKCINLRSFDTREGVKTIRQQVFYDCFGLTSVTIGENVEELEGVVFNNCYRLVEIYNLSDLTFEIGKTSNGQIAFNARVIHTSREVNSSLSTDENGFVILKDGENKVVVDYVGEGGDIVIPAGVSEINPYAFYQNDNIKNVTVSRDVYRIGRYAFYAMDLLEGVTLEEKSGWWRSNIADATSGNEITAEQIADAQATATALAKTYFSAFWNREKES